MTEQVDTSAELDLNSVDWSDETARQTAIQNLIQKEVEGLKNKNAELIAATKELKGKAKVADEIDVEEYRALKTAREESERKALEKKGEFDKLLAREKDKFAAEVAKRDEQVTRLRSALEAKLVDAEAVAAISAAGGSAKLLLPHVKSHTRVVEAEDGSLKVEVLDREGLPIEGGFPALIEGLKTDEDFMGAFRSTAASGGGAANQGEVTRGVVNPYATATFNMTEQAKLERSNPELAALLKKQAGI